MKTKPKSEPAETPTESATVSESPESPSPAPNADVDANVAAMLEALSAMSKERDDAKDGMMRAMAELQNVRRRSQEQLEQTRKIATESLTLRILPVLDNFERSLKALENGANVDAVVDGIRGIEKQLRGALDTVFVTRIETVGKPFNPEMHDAIAIDDNPDFPPDTVSDEIEAGYMMAGQVIRPAKVRVTKHS